MESMTNSAEALEEELNENNKDIDISEENYFVNMDFDTLYTKTQKHISSKFAKLLAENTDENAAKEQLTNILIKYVKDRRIRVKGYSFGELIQRLYQEMAELSILTPLLDIGRTDIEEININRFDDIKVSYDNGDIITYPEHFRSPEHALDVMKRLLKKESSLILDNSRPIVRGHLKNRIRLTIMGEGVIDRGIGTSASLRIINPKRFKGEDFIKRGTATAEMLELLTILIEYGVSVCITGETGSGKTTLLMFLAGNIDNNRRIFCIEEDVREFDLTRRDESGKVINSVVHTHTRKSDDSKQTIDQDRLLETALTMNPDVIVVSEMKGKEANAAQEASRTGHTVLTTTHAGSCRATYKRMVSLCLQGVNMKDVTLLELVKEAFPIVVHIQKDQDNVRRIREITECYLDENDSFQIQTLYRYKVESNEKIDGKLKITGEYEKVKGISRQMRERLINRNMTNELLVKLL